MNGYMGYYGYGMGYGGMLFGLLFWILIIALAYMLIKRLVAQNKTHGEEHMSALEFAKMRYAKGEITEDQFEEIKKRIV